MMPGWASREQVAVALYHHQQLKRMLERAVATGSGKRGGTVSDDRRSFMEANVVGIASSPSKEPGTTPSLNARARALSDDSGIGFSTAKRLLSNAAAKRAKLTEGAEGVSWSDVAKRRGHSKWKITEGVRMALHDWILSHPRVVQSPIASDTLLVRNAETGKKERVGKLLLEISVRELHNDLISTATGGLVDGLPEARDAKGKVVISDTSLRYLLPPQLKAMTERHKQMCGCETCIVADQLQLSLNAARVRWKHEMLAAVAQLPKIAPVQRTRIQAHRPHG